MYSGGYERHRNRAIAKPIRCAARARQRRGRRFADCLRLGRLCGVELSPYLPISSHRGCGEFNCLAIHCWRSDDAARSIATVGDSGAGAGKPTHLANVLAKPVSRDHLAQHRCFTSSVARSPGVLDTGGLRCGWAPFLADGRILSSARLLVCRRCDDRDCGGRLLPHHLPSR